MNDYLTRKEIIDRFNAEWVLLGNPKTTKSLDVVGGTVLWHSKDRDEVYRAAARLKPRRSAVLFTGKLPEGMVFIL